MVLACAERAWCVVALLVAGSASAAQPAVHARTATPFATAQAEENRRIVLKFQQAFFNDHDLGAADRLVAPGYVQHNPGYPDGRKALVDAFAKVFQQYSLTRAEVIRSAVDGDQARSRVGCTTPPSVRPRNGRMEGRGSRSDKLILLAVLDRLLQIH